MATSFVIACPECKKQMKVTDAHVGKKIRCKECQATFTVKAPKSVASPPAKPAAKANPKAKAKPVEAPVQAELADDDDEEEGGGGKSANPYTLEQNDDHLARCPFCAKPMESEDAIICLNCGYNTRTRIRSDTKKVHENTGGRIFLWLLPGIICAIIVVALLVTDVICWINMKEWAEGSWMQDEDDKTKWLIRPHAFTLYLTVAILMACVAFGKFAVKRLIINNKPPEIKLEKEDEVEE